MNIRVGVEYQRKEYSDLADNISRNCDTFSARDRSAAGETSNMHAGETGESGDK